MSDKCEFQPTRWSLIAAVRSGDGPGVEQALDTICQAYWYPLYAYVRRAGHPPEDAADLTQGFFAHLLGKGLLARADAERGRLRTFLLTSLQHFIRDEWRHQQRLRRGGGQPLLSIDEAAAEGLYSLEPVELATPESLYHRRWALTLLERTMQQLEADYAGRGKTVLFDALKPTLTGDQDAAASQKTGVQLGMTHGAVRVAVFRMRARYRERLLAEVAASMDARSDAELDDEIDALFRALS